MIAGRGGTVHGLRDTETLAARLRDTETTGELPSLAVTIAERLRPRVSSLASTHGVRAYSALRDDFDVLCFRYVVEACAALGWTPRPGEVVTATSLANAFGVVPAHSSLFVRMLEILEEDGVLEPSGAGWTVVQAPGEGRADDLHDAVVSQHPHVEPELALLARCARALPRVVRGEVDPLQILFPGGSIEPVESYYATAPTSRALNTLVGEAVAVAVERWNDREPIRILEVGAGTGSATVCVLPWLQPDNTEYVFTDVSRFFTLRAMRRFRNERFIRVRELDLEIDPARQDAAERFDVVVAANVLHATSDLRRTLRHVRQLLRPGGLLVLREAVVRQRRSDLIFGLSKGWWKFTDLDLRPKHALLSVPQWLALLAASGFVHAAPIPADAGEGADFVQAVFVAESEEELP